MADPAGVRRLASNPEALERSPWSKKLELVHSKSVPASAREYLIEVDVIRGVALVLMVAFHLTFDLKSFTRLSFELPSWYWDTVAKFIGYLFFSTAGIAAWLGSTEPNSFRRTVKRGLKLCLIAAGISAGTALFMPEHTIYFGVIHCIAVCVLLSYPFLRYRRYNLMLGLLLTVAGIALNQFRFPFSGLVWLGFLPEQGNGGGDHYPLLPWSGIVLVGIWIGEKLYPSTRERRSLWPKTLGRNWAAPGLQFLGRHSLIIYLIHQPILIGAIRLFGI